MDVFFACASSYAAVFPKMTQNRKNTNSTIPLTLFQLWYDIFPVSCYKQRQAEKEYVEYFLNLVICLSQLNIDIWKASGTGTSPPGTILRM